MKILKAYFHFYKGIFFLPLILSIILLIFSIPDFIIFLTKILIFGIIWGYNYLDDPQNKKLYFYFNLGIPKMKLYAFSFLVDFIFFSFITKFI